MSFCESVSFCVSDFLWFSNSEKKFLKSSISDNKTSRSDLALDKWSVLDSDSDSAFTAASAYSLVNLSAYAVDSDSNLFFFFSQSFFFNNFVLNDLYHKKSATIPMAC